MDLSVIIVNWHSSEYLRKCLASVIAQTRGLEFEVIVIDAGSYDGCGSMLREEFPSVHFIQSPVNLGFARANNRAFEDAKGEVLLFLNPDTEVVGPAIETLFLEISLLPRAGAVGARLLNSDRSLQTTCVRAMPTILNKALDSEFLKARWPMSRLWGMAPLFESGAAVRQVEAISGACLMVTRRAFEAVGRFTEEYFMYAEDIDLCHKLRATGLSNYFVPAATVIHHGGGSSSKESGSVFSAVMMPEANLRFLRRTRGKGYALCYRGAMAGAALVRLPILGVAQTLYALRLRRAPLSGSLRKWVAVLRWSLSNHELVQQHYPAERQR